MPVLLSTLLGLDTPRGDPLPEAPSPTAAMEAGWTPDLGFRQSSRGKEACRKVVPDLGFRQFSAGKDACRKVVPPHQSDVLHMLEDGEDWEMSDLVVW